MEAVSTIRSRNRLWHRVLEGQSFQAIHSEIYDISTEEGFSAFRQNKDEDDVTDTYTTLDALKQRVSPSAGSTQCIFQRTRPQHRRGTSDSLPFISESVMLDIFAHFRLPLDYLHIADGALGIVHPRVHTDKDGKPSSLELMIHCISKQGDWAMVISHQAEEMITNVFWSVDKRIDADSLLANLKASKDLATHPLLVPCIMYDEILRQALRRRSSIKVRLQHLEAAVSDISAREADTSAQAKLNSSINEVAEDLGELFKILHSCRKDQESREGRYDFWHTYREALDVGFSYYETITSDSCTRQAFKSQYELRGRKSLVDRKLQSLIARDRDHVNSVNSIADLLYNLVRQREVRLQSSIAQTAQSDSEDMKFLAVLGSVFLPASLIATLLNVQEWQFASGGVLFAAYIGITIPLIAMILLVCYLRPRWYRLFIPSNHHAVDRESSQAMIWATRATL